MSEDQNTEWKESWRDDYLKWLCGIANAQGGVLEVGRNYKGQVVGVKDAARLMEELPNKLRDLLGIVADINLLEENGKPYLRPFNPDVANAFFRAGEIEAWGRGIQRILDACREAGTPEPRIQVEPGDLWFEFPFSEAYLEGVSERVMPEASGDTTQKTTQKTIPDQILDLLREDASVSRRTIAEQLEGITEDGVKYHLGKLKAAGRIRRVGPDRGGRWEVIGDSDE